MTSVLDLEKLERRAYLIYNQDGFMDLALGLYVLSFGLDMLFHAYFAAISPLLLLALFWLSKRKITYPRLGFVKFSLERTKLLKKAMFAMVVALVISVLLGVVAFLGASGYLPGLREFFRQYSLLLFGGLLAGLIILAGLTLDNWRLHVYAALTLAAFIVGYSIGLHPRFFMIPLGAIISISGLVVLIRFLRKYPLPVEGEDS